MLGQLCPLGTGAFDLLLDEEKLVDSYPQELMELNPGADGNRMANGALPPA